MGINQFPAPAAGIQSVVRSVQRGVAASAGNITITAVDVSKTQVTSFSTTSSGSVATSGSLSGTSSLNSIWQYSGGSNPYPAVQYIVTGDSRYGFNIFASYGTPQTITHSGTISGGSTTLVAGVNGAYLSNSTTLVVTGPCRYEVVEYV
jgi:hypothetical protein